MRLFHPFIVYFAIANKEETWDEKIENKVMEQQGMQTTTHNTTK
jgi:hypothetical protein